MKRFVLLACLCLLPFAAAQEEGAAVTVERLAELLVGNGEKVTFLPNSLPEGLDLPLPEGARVLGSATVGEDETITALELQGDWEESRTIVGEALEAAGWSGYDPFGDAQIFQEPVRDESNSSRYYCSPDGSSEAYLNANDFSGGTLVILNTHRYCGASQQELAPLPNITFPVGVISYGGGTSQGGNAFQADVRYTTDLSAESLFENFAAQLTAQHWHVEGATETDGTMSANLTLETEGETWRGLLNVTGNSAILQISRLQ